MRQGKGRIMRHVLVRFGRARLGKARHGVGYEVRCGLVR